MLQAIARSTSRRLPLAARPATVSLATKSPMEDTGGPVGDEGVIIEAGETVTRTEEPASLDNGDYRELPVEATTKSSKGSSSTNTNNTANDGFEAQKSAPPPDDSEIASDLKDRGKVKTSSLEKDIDPHSSGSVVGEEAKSAGAKLMDGAKKMFGVDK